MKKYWVLFILFLSKSGISAYADAIVPPPTGFERNRLFFVGSLVLGVLLLTRLIQKQIRK